MPYYPPGSINSAGTTSFVADGDIQSVTVQAAIAEVAAERAKSGENTDITSLGSFTHPISINGELSLPNVSRFKVSLASLQRINATGNYSKINFNSVVFDKLLEYTNQRFVVKHAGVYLLNGGISAARDNANGEWRLILTIYINGTEALRGEDKSLLGQYSGATVAGILDVNANDYVELFLYTSHDCNLDINSALTRFSGIKIA